MSLIKSKVVGQVINVLREEGVKSFWFKLLGDVGYRRLLLLERPLQEPIAEVSPRLPVTIDLLKMTEVAEYLKFRVETTSCEVMAQLNAGHWCFVARHEGRIVAASWAADRRAWIFYLACEIRLLDGEVYVYDSFTRPDFRGQAVSPAIRTEMIRYFRAAGYRRMILGTVPENHANLQAVRKVGFRPFGVMGYIKIGPWRRDFYRTNRNRENTNG